MSKGPPLAIQVSTSALAYGAHSHPRGRRLDADLAVLRDRDCRDHDVFPVAKASQHGPGVVRVNRLVEDGAVEDDYGVGGEDHRLGVCCGDLCGFSFREAPRQGFRRLAGLHGLVDAGDGNLEGQAEVGNQFPAARRC